RASWYSSLASASAGASHSRAFLMWLRIAPTSPARLAMVPSSRCTCAASGRRSRIAMQTARADARSPASMRRLASRPLNCISWPGVVVGTRLCPSGSPLHWGGPVADPGNAPDDVGQVVGDQQRPAGVHRNADGAAERDAGLLVAEAGGEVDGFAGDRAPALERHEH